MTTLQLSEIRVKTVGALWILMSLLFISGCGNEPIPEPEAVDCLEVNFDSSAMPAYAGIRGALLTSRFSSLEELKSVVNIEYFPNSTEEGRAYSGDSLVRLIHCSNGQTVVSILAQGVDEGDFSKALRNGVIEKAAIGFRSPFAVENRQWIQRVEILARRRQRMLGEGDATFYDLALAMTDHITNKDFAFQTVLDSSEKGYLNTFNHITAQAFITSLYSEEVADFVADVHERQTLPELMNGRFTNVQLRDFNVNPVDNYVDIINNEWGQELGKVLRAKHQLTTKTDWTPNLVAAYLNDVQTYYRWAFQIGMTPFRPQDTLVTRFSEKLNFVQAHLPH